MLGSSRVDSVEPTAWARKAEGKDQSCWRHHNLTSLGEMEWCQALQRLRHVLKAAFAATSVSRASSVLDFPTMHANGEGRVDGYFYTMTVFLSCTCVSDLDFCRFYLFCRE